MRLQLSKEELEEYKARARTSPWLAYPLTAVPKILPWHESTARYRVLSGPNNCGKSTAGAADFVSYPLGYNPIRKETYTTPNVSWAVCVEYNSAGRVMFRKISDMLPRTPAGAPKWKYFKQEHIIELDNGSVIQIKSQKEGESSLLAERCRAIWIDEAMGGERGNENFGELQARGLPDEPLDMLFTLTPKLDIGLDWMRRKLWCGENERPHEDFIPGTACVQFDIDDCLIEKGGFLTPEYVNLRKLTVDPVEADARLHGNWTPFLNRPAFSYKLLLNAMERAPVSKPVKFHRLGVYHHGIEYVESAVGQMQREAESQHSYIGAWDPSSGLGKSHDYSSFVVLDRSDLCVVFHARSQELGPDQFFSQIVQPASEYYGQALMVIENNGQSGGSAVQAARDSQYSNIYMQKRLDKALATYTDRLGWSTNDQSRGRMIDALKRALIENKWTPCRDLLDEMSHMNVKRSPSGHIKVEHMDGFHDDLVMAAGIALAVHYEEPIYDFPDFRKLRVRYAPEGAAYV